MDCSFQEVGKRTCVWHASKELEFFLFSKPVGYFFYLIFFFCILFYFNFITLKLPTVFMIIFHGCIDSSWYNHFIM